MHSSETTRFVENTRAHGYAHRVPSRVRKRKTKRSLGGETALPEQGWGALLARIKRAVKSKAQSRINCPQGKCQRFCYCPSFVG